MIKTHFELKDMPFSRKITSKGKILRGKKPTVGTFAKIFERILMF